ncbi:hypothetical protein JCM3766R1_005557 [Sporobolomyces carnicolor]
MTRAQRLIATVGRNLAPLPLALALPFPIEIRQRILLHLPPLATIHSGRRTHSTTTTAFANLAHDDDTNHDDSTAAAAAWLFEPVSTVEYSTVPRSTLDDVTAAAARSPRQALLSLLERQEYDDAHALYRELVDQGVEIEPGYEFARFALETLELDKNVWFDWWQLTPSSLPSSTAMDDNAIELHRIKRRDANHFNLARDIAHILLTRVDTTTTTTTTRHDDDSDDSADRRRRQQLEQFATSLARQGQSRIVAEEILFDLALSRRRGRGSSLDVALDLWRTCDDELARQEDQLVGDGVEVQGRPRDKFDEWLTNKLTESRKVVWKTLESIVKALINLGEPDRAIDILVSTRTRRRGGGGGHFTKKFYLVVLSHLSRRDRFDLFNRVYETFERVDRNVLVRIRDATLKSWTPYFARSREYHQDPAPSAQEAFLTFRDQHVVSSIEEGPPIAARASKTYEISDEDLAADYSGGLYLNHDQGTPTGLTERLGNLADEIESCLDADSTDERKRRLLDLAVESMSRIVLSGGGGGGTTATLPSAPSVARLIDLVETRHANGPLVIETVSELVEHESINKKKKTTTGRARLSFWTTCRIVHDVAYRNDLELAVTRFRDHFDTRGLPVAVLDAIDRVTVGTASTRTSLDIDDGDDADESTMIKRQRQTRLAKAPVNAYTVSVLMQALVPLLLQLEHEGTRLVDDNDAASASSPPIETRRHDVRRIFDTLFDPDAYAIVPSHLHHHDHRLDRQRGDTRRTSRLDPYTFIPFLLVVLRDDKKSSSHRHRRRRTTLFDNNNNTTTTTGTTSSVVAGVPACERILDILGSMSEIGVEPQLAHVSILLSAYLDASVLLDVEQRPRQQDEDGDEDVYLEQFRYLMNRLELYHYGRHDDHDEMEQFSSSSSSSSSSSLSPRLVEFVDKQFPLPSSPPGTTTTPTEKKKRGNTLPRGAPSARLYASVLKSLRFRHERLEQVAGRRQRTEDDEGGASSSSSKLEAMSILKRLIASVGVEGLRDLMASRDGGVALTNEVARLSSTSTKTKTTNE